jgi:fructose-1,6-bisphosphatase/inositol monophosphatase family enzyme
VIDRVTHIVRGVAHDFVMPSFHALRPEDILAKHTPDDPDDIVTLADRATERRLVEALDGLVPGAVFVGEEAACENPSLVDVLFTGQPAWVIDPIDGTKNFARGKPGFGVMVALVEGGATRASWIALPALATMLVAEAGRGTLLNDAAPPHHRIPGRPRGTVHDRLMPPATASKVGQALRDRFDALPSSGAAAVEYAALVRGDKDFVIYYRLLPWDQLPGALAVVEAGGAAIHLDGRSYTPRSSDQVTILAASPELAEMVRGWING